MPPFQPPPDGTLLRLLADRVELGLILLDNAGRVDVWNRWIAQRAGVAASDAVGRPLTEIWTEASIGRRVLQAIHQALADGQSSLLTASLNRQLLPLFGEEIDDSGETLRSPLEHSVVITPLHWEGAFYCVLQINDLTEARRRERYLRAQAQDLATLAERLSHARDAAEMAGRAKSQFLANMSHELKTPLHVIIGFAEMLHEMPELPDDKRIEFALEVKNAGAALLGLVDNLLDAAKAESGDQGLNLEQVLLDELLDSCLLVVREKAKPRNIDLSVRRPRGQVLLNVDRRKFMGVMMHLLSNAVKFNRDGGHCDVQIDAAPHMPLVITISDTGCGMSEEDIAYALRPFAQVDESLVRPAGGAGLGLPLAKAFAEAHGGGLSLESEKDVGVTVTVTFPAACVVSVTSAPALRLGR